MVTNKVGRESPRRGLGRCMYVIVAALSAVSDRDPETRARVAEARNRGPGRPQPREMRGSLP